MKNITYKNFTIHQAPSLESTNSTAFEMAKARQLFEHEIVLADQQMAGRGRMQRNWISPKGNLYFSLVMQPKVPVSKVAQLSFVAITALRLAVEEVSKGKNHLHIQNKWPNDLLINGKKVAGLLLESQNNGSECEFVVVGIGVNIASNPDNTIFPAANLKDYDIEISPLDLLYKFLDKFDNLYQHWLDFGFAGVRKLWITGCYKYKEKITLKDGDAQIEGVLEDLEDDGRVVLLTQSGWRKFSAVDVL